MVHHRFPAIRRFWLLRLISSTALRHACRVSTLRLPISTAAFSVPASELRPSRYGARGLNNFSDGLRYRCWCEAGSIDLRALTQRYYHHLPLRELAEQLTRGAIRQVHFPVCTPVS